MNINAARDVLETIKKYDKIIIFRHFRPDGDAVGSTKGLGRILQLSFPEKEVILQNGWNLPARDFLPETLEEQLICFADKFFSKTKFLKHPRTFEQVVESMAKISEKSVEKVQDWARIFM